MEIKEKVNYWLAIAEYDFETAKAMYISGRYLYVGFMCHQVLEKALKAHYWIVLKKEPPYTHKLEVLVAAVNLTPSLSETQNRLIDKLTPLNIQIRYPKNMELMMSSIDRDVSEKLINETEIFFQWIKQQIGS
ncbi:MAG: HEPN domain-containing protein [Candidatus Wallbacteria bacterium]|nr:HEPN domain-containing protein [Candidatus Wallbacteria bacterium]